MSSPFQYERILIGTTNRAKAMEIAEFLDGCAAEFIFLENLPHVDEPVEDGESFKDNALIKARYYAEVHKMPTVTDDSGLMVDALDGAPGVRSSRLVPPGGNDEERIEKLLAMMAHLIDPEDRTAKFVCAAVLVDPQDERELVEEGVLHGKIAFKPSGSTGFGYDPIFIPEGYSLSVASLGPIIKNKISHRRHALNKLVIKITGPVAEPD